MPKIGWRKSIPELHLVQMTISIPKILEETIAKESKKLGISKTEYVRQCITACSIHSETYRELLKKYKDRDPKSYPKNPEEFTEKLYRVK